MTTTYRVSGTLRGAIWWPIGEPAEKTFEYSTRQRPDSLRDLVERVMSAEDGDFSDAPKFLADCVLTVIRWRTDGLGHRSRSFYLDNLPSIADYVAADELPTWED